MYSRFSDEQKQIVLCPPDRHAKVTAVAGSGKSTVLVERIAYLQEVHRTHPDLILAVMFNKDAAVQLTERLHKRLGRANTPQCLTFHGLGTQMLSMLTRAGKTPPWRFEQTPSKQVRFVEQCLGGLMDKHNIRRKRMVAELFLGFVDRVKGDLLPPKTVLLRDDDLAAYDWFVPAFALFEQQRAKQGVRFFSDLIYDPLVAIRRDPEAAKLVANLREHIVVDEFQDICESQMRLVRAAAGDRAKLMVVGDDDQTIYTWRGAQPDYILHKFADIYTNPIEFKLSRTWRYGHALSVAANYVICNNTVRTDKLCVSGNKARRTQIRLVTVPNAAPAPKDKDQDAVSDKAKSHQELVPEIHSWLKKKDATLSDIAILFRTYGRSGEAQLELLNAGIAYRMSGPESAVLFENRWVKFLIAWLRLAAGDFCTAPFAGEPDFGSIRQVSDLVSPDWIDGIWWPESNELAKALLANPDATITIPRFIQGQPNLSMLAINQLRSLAQVWEFMRNLSKRRPILSGQLPADLQAVRFDDASSVLDFVVERFKVPGVIAKRSSGLGKAEDDINLLQAFTHYIKMKEFDVEQALVHIQHLISFSNSALKALDALTLTSVHRSKGLEWPCVIMPGLRQGWFPHVRGAKAGEPVVVNPDDLEDERRLFYVAMTRACERLVLLAPEDAHFASQMNRGSTQLPTTMFHAASASQFLYEMNYRLSCFTAIHLETGRFTPKEIASFADHKLALQYLDQLKAET